MMIGVRQRKSIIGKIAGLSVVPLLAGFLVIVSIVGIIGAVVNTNSSGNSTVNVDGCTPYPAIIATVRNEPAFLEGIRTNHLEAYTNLILALISQESGSESDPETYNDPMQAAEGAGLPWNAGALGLITRAQSYKYGCAEFAARLKGANVTSPTDWEHIYIMLQGYNFGGGFVTYVAAHGGKWTQELTNTFSDEQARIHGWATYGDKNYVRNVLKFDPDYFQAGAPGYTGGVGSGTWLWPTPSCNIVTTEWLQVDSVHSIPHHGIDIGASYGAQIISAAAGTVTEAENDGGWGGGFGNHAYIKTGNATAIYGHMSQCVVHTGEKVSAGQVIGYVGSTGNSTGAHLHFQVVVDDTWNNYGDARNNPWNYVKKN